MVREKGERGGLKEREGERESTRRSMREEGRQSERPRKGGLGEESQRA
jgi:hypothetical protein